MRYDTERMKENISICDAAIRSGIEMKKKGSNYFFLCPDHDDTNPSCYCSQNGNFYYCNSCGANGDIFDLVKNYNKRYFDNDMTFNQVCELILSEEPTKSEYILSKSKVLEKEKNTQMLKQIPLSDELFSFIGINPNPQRIYSLIGIGDKSDAKNYIAMEYENEYMIFANSSEQFSIKKLFYEDTSFFMSIVVPKALEKLAYLEKNPELLPHCIDLYEQLCDFVCLVYQTKSKENNTYLEKAEVLKKKKNHAKYSNMFHIQI